MQFCKIYSFNIKHIFFCPHPHPSPLVISTQSRTWSHYLPAPVVVRCPLASSTSRKRQTALARSAQQVSSLLIMCFSKSDDMKPLPRFLTTRWFHSYRQPCTLPVSSSMAPAVPPALHCFAAAQAIPLGLWKTLIFPSHQNPPLSLLTTVLPP